MPFNLVSKVAETIFGGVWRLMLRTDFPGLGVSIASVAVSLLLIRFSIRLFSFFTGFGAGVSDYGRAADSAEKIRDERARRERIRSLRALPPAHTAKTSKR